MSETRRASWRSENASELHGAYMAPMKQPCGAAIISRSQLDAALIDLHSHLAASKIRTLSSKSVAMHTRSIYCTVRVSRTEAAKRARVDDDDAEK